MASTLLDVIERAEAQADQIREDARREACEIVKAVEQANALMEREQTREMDEAFASRMEAARAGVLDEIRALELRRESEREAMKRTAQARVSSAGIHAFERVVNHDAR